MGRDSVCTIGWPVAAGMLAHAAHWWLMTAWGVNLATAAFAACLLVGTPLVAVAHWLRMTLAFAIGFASVVSFMPGSFVFRMLSGLIQLPGSASPNVWLRRCQTEQSQRWWLSAWRSG